MSRDLAGAREGHLAELFDAAGLRDIESTVESADLEHADVRGVVGAVHARRRARRRPRGEPGAGRAGRPSRAMPDASWRRAVHDPGARLGCPGRGLTGSASFG